jgi:hypothetical protein
MRTASSPRACDPTPHSPCPATTRRHATASPAARGTSWRGPCPPGPASTRRASAMLVDVETCPRHYAQRPRWARRSTRIRRVSARVSMPASPIGHCPSASRRSAARCGSCSAAVTFSRTTQPSACGLVAFHILVVRADVADVRKGESDDLTRIRGIRHHFLIAGHRSVETHLAHRRAFGTDSRGPTGPNRRQARVPPSPGGLGFRRGGRFGRCHVNMLRTGNRLNGGVN